MQKKRELSGMSFAEQEALLTPPDEGGEEVVAGVAPEEAAAVTAERSTSLDQAPKHGKSTGKKRSYSTYTPKDKKRLKRDVKDATKDGSLASKVTRVITRDGDSKTFEELKGLDGLTFGITDFATTGGIHTFFVRFAEAFPKDIKRLFPTLYKNLTDEKWLAAHNAGKGSGAEADDAGLITLPEVRIGLAKLLADPKYRKFQIGEFARGKISGPQRLLDKEVKRKPGEKGRENGGDEAYGKVLRQFTVAALASVANSAGPGVAVPWFRDGLAGAGSITGIARENAACIYMLRRYLQTAHPERELKRYPDGVAFLDAAVASPAGALAKKWKLGHRGKRIEKLFEVFDWNAADPVPSDIMAPQAASAAGVKGDEPAIEQDEKEQKSVAAPEVPKVAAATDKGLSASQTKDALKYNRGRPFAKQTERLGLMQKAMGAAPSGVVDEATVIAAAAFQTKAGTKGDGKIGPTTEGLLQPLVVALTPAPKVEAKAESKPVAKGEAPPKVEAPKVEAPAKVAEAKVDAPQVKGEAGALTPESWATVPPALRPKASGPLADKEIGRAVDELASMKKRLDPTWIIAVQSSLGVPATGGFSRAFLQAVAKFEVERMGRKRPSCGLASSEVRDALKGAFPALAKLPEFFEAGAMAGAKEKLGSGTTLHDRIVKEAGVGKSWQDYTSAIRSTELVGHTVNGNAAFIERVQVAQKYLETKFKLTGKALGKAVGVSTVTDMRPPEGKWAKKAGYHTFGFALDLDPANNPWIMREKGDQTKAQTKHLKDVLGRAAALMGYGEAISQKVVKDMADTSTSDEIYAYLQTSNVALRNYRNLAGSEQAIQQQLDKSPAAKKMGDVKWWSAQIKADDAKLDDKSSAWCNAHSNKGFMTMREEMVIALRDIAGLAWGGCDLGNDAGDMMHFDARNFGYAKKIDKTADKVKADMGLK